MALKTNRHFLDSLHDELKTAGFRIDRELLWHDFAGGRQLVRPVLHTPGYSGAQDTLAVSFGVSFERIETLICKMMGFAPDAVTCTVEGHTNLFFKAKRSEKNDRDLEKELLLYCRTTIRPFFDYHAAVKNLEYMIGKSNHTVTSLRPVLLKLILAEYAGRPMAPFIAEAKTQCRLMDAHPPRELRYPVVYLPQLERYLAFRKKTDIKTWLDKPARKK